MNFDHNGIAITLNGATGKFSATVAGQKITRSSLPSIKKFIDKQAKNAFVPITILRPASYFGGEKTVAAGYVRSTMTEPPRLCQRRYRKSTKVTYVDGDRAKTVEDCVCYEDTPAAIAILKELEAFRKEDKRIRAEMEKKLDSIKARLVKHAIVAKGVKDVTIDE